MAPLWDALCALLDGRAERVEMPLDVGPSRFGRIDASLQGAIARAPTETYLGRSVSPARRDFPSEAPHRAHGPATGRKNDDRQSRFPRLALSGTS